MINQEYSFTEEVKEVISNVMMDYIKNKNPFNNYNEIFREFNIKYHCDTYENYLKLQSKSPVPMTDNYNEIYIKGMYTYIFSIIDKIYYALPRSDNYRSLSQGNTMCLSTYNDNIKYIDELYDNHTVLCPRPVIIRNFEINNINDIDICKEVSETLNALNFYIENRSKEIDAIIVDKRKIMTHYIGLSDWLYISKNQNGKSYDIKDDIDVVTMVNKY
jgi:hypothetical protein